MQFKHESMKYQVPSMKYNTLYFNNTPLGFSMKSMQIKNICINC